MKPIVLSIMKHLARIIFRALFGIFLFSIIIVIAYRYIPIPVTPLMLTRYIQENEAINYEWTALKNINPELVLAVVASEDNLFTEHNGFDFEAIKLAHYEAKSGKRLRGASTISQQTAKNVFLWNGRSWLRKGLEAYFTVLIEIFWGKERIMEVYLNCIEMGKGIYGVKAVAKHHFKKSPDKLTRAECARIAATLPNPRRFNSAKPSKYIKSREKTILKFMKNIHKVEFK